MGQVEISLVEKWKMQFEVANALLMHNKGQNNKWHNDSRRIVQIKYENLVDGNQRIAEIMKVIHHLYDLNDNHMENNDYFIRTGKWNRMEQMNYAQLVDLIECGFHYQDPNSNKFHRSHANISGNSSSDDGFVDMAYAYRSL